jgi:hypothetical protein
MALVEVPPGHCVTSVAGLKRRDSEIRRLSEELTQAKKAADPNLAAEYQACLAERIEYRDERDQALSGEAEAQKAREGMRQRLAERAAESEHRLTLAKKNAERWEKAQAEVDRLSVELAEAIEAVTPDGAAKLIKYFKRERDLMQEGLRAVSKRLGMSPTDDADAIEHQADKVFHGRRRAVETAKRRGDERDTYATCLAYHRKTLCSCREDHECNVCSLLKVQGQND